MKRVTHGNKLQKGRQLVEAGARRKERRTQNETACTEKSVHEIESPFYDLLQVRRYFTDEGVERPIGRC